VGLDDILSCHELAVDLGLDSHDLASVHESLDVVLEPEHCGPLGGAVDPDTLEDTGTVIERVAEDVHLGVLPVDDVPVEPNLLCFVHLNTFSDMHCY